MNNNFGKKLGNFVAGVMITCLSALIIAATVAITIWLIKWMLF